MPNRRQAEPADRKQRNTSKKTRPCLAACPQSTPLFWKTCT
jgi:hypothetical protein